MTRRTVPTTPPETTAPDADRGDALPTWLGAALDTTRALGLPDAIVRPMQAAVERLVEGSRRQARTLQRVLLSSVPQVARLLPPSAPAVSRATGRPSGIRLRFVIAGATGAVALVVAILLVAAPPGQAEGGGPDDEPSPSAHAAQGPVRTSLDEAAGGRPVAASDAPEGVLHPEPEEWHGIVAELVARWSACRASATGGAMEGDCATLVAHAGSAAERLLFADDDRHTVLERWTALRGDSVVVERMGGAVLIDLVAAGTTTASLLVVRSEAGWRIRDVIG